MAYTDPNFNVRVTRPLFGAANAGTVLTTNTASGTNTLAAIITLPKFIRATVVSALQLYTVAASANSTGTLSFLNGTNTFATVALGTSGQVSAGTVTAAFSTFTAGASPTCTAVSTGTASGQTLGTCAVEIEVSELFS